MPDYTLRKISDPGACVHCRFAGLAQVVYQVPGFIRGFEEQRAIKQIVCSRGDCDYHEQGSPLPENANLVGMQLLQLNGG